MRPTTENYKITHMREEFELTKYPREKNCDLRNTHEKKFGTHGIPMRKDLGPTKYSREKIGTHAIPSIKNLGPTKYPRKKIWNPRNTHEGTMAR